MPRIIQFEGMQHSFPDDATDEEIAAALGAMHPPLRPEQNPRDVGGELGRKDAPLTREERIAVLQAQLKDPNHDPMWDSEIEAEIKRIGGAQPSTSAPAAPAPTAPAAPAAAPPADEKTPMQRQDERWAQWNKDRLAWIQATGGRLKPGQDVFQAVAEFSGHPDPREAQRQAESDQFKDTGELVSGNSLAYNLAKPVAAIAGFVGGGPAGATAAESVVRAAALTYNLQQKINDGLIDEDGAAKLLTKELLKGSGTDAAFNFGIPILGELITKVPGATWLVDKVKPLLEAAANKMGLTPQPAVRLRDVKLGKLEDQADNTAQKAAIQELGQRTGKDIVPTPGQVSEEGASPWESGVRRAAPAIFNKADKELIKGAESYLYDATTPATQPERQQIGQKVLDVADKVERAVKTRLRPTFDAAENLGVRVDMSDIENLIKDTLARRQATPSGALMPDKETTALDNLYNWFENNAQRNVRGQPMLAPQAALDFSRDLKALLRATPDYQPSVPFQKTIGDLVAGTEGAYEQAANASGNAGVRDALLKARGEYQNMLETVYKGGIGKALKKEMTPEDIGKTLWGGGNVAEIQNLRDLVNMAQQETLGGARSAVPGIRTRTIMKPDEAKQFTGDVTRAFLQEAVPNVEAAARWSQTLREKPGARDTWNALTGAPGGMDIRRLMEVVEQAAQIATKTNYEVASSGTIPVIGTSMAKGAGMSSQTVKPSMVMFGLSLTGITHMAATAYTHGDKGVWNSLIRVLRLSNVGTPAATKTVQELLPQLQQAADKYGVTDFIKHGGQQEETGETAPDSEVNE